MIYKVLAAFFFTVVCATAGAQVMLKGKVLDNTTNQPLVNASVYLNNTSTGTVTNSEGAFILNIKNIYSGELIVSSVGYQPLLYQLNNAAGNYFYTFRLDIKEKELKNVLIINDATRAEWLKIFKENFLGITEEGDNCTIKNLDQLYFTSGKNNHSFYAYADTPLIIINKLLGYKISFDLVEFNYNKESGGTYFVGYNHYEETGDAKRFIKRRKQIFYGSTIHFYRSLIANKLIDAGYAVFEMQKPPQIAGAVIKENQPGNQDKDSAVRAVRVMADSIQLADTVSGVYYLHSSGRLLVHYNKKSHSTYYLSNKGFVQGLSRTGFTSYINLLSEKIGMDKNGIIKNPLQVIYNGFWVYEKLGNQLPFDYQPE